MSFWPFKRSRADEDAERLLAAVTAASRQPVLFGPGRAPDTLEGRFEVMTLHASLALIRLAADPNLAPLAQSFTDKLFRQFDAGLREEGVGDTSVPKSMRKMAGEFYGRLEAYSAAIRASDASALAAALSRNVLLAGSEGFAAQWATMLLGVAAQQAQAPVDSLFSAQGWDAAGL